MLILLATGCFTLLHQTPQTLEDRVKEYMQAQMDGKWDVAYSFLNSAARAKTSQESYVHQIRKATVKGFEIAEISELPSGDQAKVKVRLDLAFMGFDLKQAPHKQTWVKEKGTWFVSPQPQQGNPFAPEQPQAAPSVPSPEKK
jgi:hypothetical protein